MRRQRAALQKPDALAGGQYPAEVMGVSTKTIHSSVQVENNLTGEARTIVEGAPVRDSKFMEL